MAIMTPDSEQNHSSKSELPTYKEITEPKVSDLFGQFIKMATVDRINIITAYCLAKALSDDEKTRLTHEETRIEYLKEAGRNERSILKSDGGGNSDDDDPLFPR